MAVHGLALKKDDKLVEVCTEHELSTSVYYPKNCGAYSCATSVFSVEMLAGAVPSSSFIFSPAENSSYTSIFQRDTRN